MIRIGLSRWYVEASQKPMNLGLARTFLSLVPQASRYKVITPVWKGLTRELSEKTIAVDKISVYFDMSQYDISKNPRSYMQSVSSIAAELANKAVSLCMNKGIVYFQDFPKIASEYLVKVAITKAIQSGKSDELNLVDEVDLVPEMREILEERQREIARQQERWEASKFSTSKSMELLRQFLNEKEIEEMDSLKRVSVISGNYGTFLVPITPHGLVARYIDGKYDGHYCIVFKDHTIPLGDEILMKIALLKADPDKFLSIANKFVHNHH